jgi:hypothetical protein
VSGLPGPARALGRAVSRAVDVAEAATDAAAYEGAIAQLAAQPAAMAGRILGDVLRAMLEEAHPDGLDADDITLVLGRAFRAASGWLPPDRVDVYVLLAVLASALGIHEPGVTYQALDLPPAGPDRVTDEWRDPDDTVPVTPPTWPQYVWHAPLLAADLLPYCAGHLGGYLEAAFAEIARAETEELP